MVVTSVPAFAATLPAWSSTISFDLTLNSQDWLPTQQAGAVFRLYEPADLAVAVQGVLFPLGPDLGPSPIDFKGSFAGPVESIAAASLEPVVRFRPLLSLPPCAGKAEPWCLSSDDPGLLNMSPSNLTELVACKFDNSLVQCLNGSAPYAAGIAVMDLSVNGGVDFPRQLHDNRFFFYRPPTLTAPVSPPNIPAAGGQSMHVLSCSVIFTQCFPCCRCEHHRARCRLHSTGSGDSSLLPGWHVAAAVSRARRLVDDGRPQSRLGRGDPETEGHHCKLQFNANAAN